MKISVDGVVIFELSETQKNVIQNDICCNAFDNDINARLQYILAHKYEQCFKRLKAEWEPKLAINGVKAIPIDEADFAQLVFKQPNYKNRTQRDLESV